MSVDKDRLTQPFPRQAVERRDGGGGRVFDYVATETVIRRLNDATANCWDFRVVETHFRGEVMLCLGELTIPGLGTRQGWGVQKVSERGGEDLFKGAASDALKKAATLFGVALELYGPDLEAGEAPNARPRPPQRPTAPPPSRTPAQADDDERRVRAHERAAGPVAGRPGGIPAEHGLVVWLIRKLDELGLTGERQLAYLDLKYGLGVDDKGVVTRDTLRASHAAELKRRLQTDPEEVLAEASSLLDRELRVVG
jgi:hypothetical protein